MKPQTRVSMIVAAVALMMVSVGTGAAHATYPGTNGRITFGRYDRSIGDYHIWAGNIDGTHQVQLTTVPSEKSDWSPDGTRIAYDFVDPNGDVQIATLKGTDGSDVAQLTTTPGFHGEPNYSPNGTRIAFDSDMGNHPAGEGIYAMNAGDGGNVVRVTTNTTGGFDGTPKWSPDGSRIAFIRYVPSEADPSLFLTALFVVRADGSGLTQITNVTLNPQDPDWSPDGKWIAFDAREYAPLGDGSQIWLVHPNGTGLHAISSMARKSNLFGPVFSPDAKQILTYGFVATRAGLWTMNTDGSNLKLLPFVPPPPLAFVDWGSAPAA